MCVGPFKRVCHWGPLTALGIVKSVSYMTIHCSSMWWPPKSSLGGVANLAMFLTCSILTLYHFLSAIYEGPGYLPIKWHPEAVEDSTYLQFCDICQGFKAPRSHHCRKCGRCVLKMDHHCPWINNCVGHVNHGHFTAFLIWAVCGCLQASVVLACSLYRALNRTWYLCYGTGSEPIVELSLHSLVFCVFCLGLAIGVVLAVGMLLYFQLRAVIRNRTAIEDWIVEKADHRRANENAPPFLFPYDLGRRRNVNQVLTLSCVPRGDGITWPVRHGCNQYTLTVEQQLQKCEKRRRSRRYETVRPFSGRWFPLSHGLGVFCHPPFTDEARVTLRVGDQMVVTRWRRYWLFGEKSQPCGDSERIRGWFPRQCVVEVGGETEVESAKDK